MVQKSKINNTFKSETLSEVGSQLGLMLMSLAVTMGMLEMPNHTNSRVVVPTQANLAFAINNDEFNNPVQREREETAPHFISYSAIQRTPGRTGKA